MKIISILLACLSMCMPLVEGDSFIMSKVPVAIEQMTNDVVDIEKIITKKPIDKINKPVTDKGFDEIYPVNPPAIMHFPSHVIYANWTNDERIYNNSLTARTDSDKKQLPMYRLNDMNDVNEFRNMFATSLSFFAYDELMNQYDDMFFLTKSLMMVYVPSNSGSCRYDVLHISKSGNTFSIEVQQTANFENGLCNMSGWFIILEVPDMIMDTCHNFSAILNTLTATTEPMPIEQPKKIWANK